MAARAPATGGRATALAWAQNGATVLRRGLLVPLVVAVEAGLLALSPLLIAGGALLSLASPWRRVPLRSVLLVLAYALVELRAVAEVAALRRGQPAPHPPDGDPPDGDPPDGDPPDGGRPDPYDEIVHRFVQRLTGAVERILGVRMVLTPDSVSGDEVRRTAPVVVLSRHAGPGDSLLVAWLLMGQWWLRPRIVLRSTLRAVPVVELALSRTPACFVGRRGSGRARAGIGRLAAALGDGDALLLFPEGGNFSVERRRLRIALLRRRREYAEARRARRMRQVLAPHAGGLIAALRAAPEADVVVLAHEGLSPPGRLQRPWWSLPVDQDVRARAWLVPRTEIPSGGEEQEQWLYAQWERVDRWVRAVRETPRDGGGEPQSFSTGA